LTFWLSNDSKFHAKITLIVRNHATIYKRRIFPKEDNTMKIFSSIINGNILKQNLTHILVKMFELFFGEIINAGKISI